MILINVGWMHELPWRGSLNFVQRQVSQYARSGLGSGKEGDAAAENLQHTRSIDDSLLLLHHLKVSRFLGDILKQNRHASQTLATTSRKNARPLWQTLVQAAEKKGLPFAVKCDWLSRIYPCSTIWRSGGKGFYAICGLDRKPVVKAIGYGIHAP